MKKRSDDLLSLFSGIGAFEKALENLKIKYELFGFSEINKHAINSYCAIHNVDESKNLGDISKINKLPQNIDLITYGFPCQDLSIVGSKKGFKGKKSVLLYEALRIIKTNKPKYAIAENVKNLIGKKFKKDFQEYLKILESYGYNNYYKVMNAKDYGIPQNRERIFIVSIRKDIDNNNFIFPQKEKLQQELKDYVDYDYKVPKHILNSYKRKKGDFGKRLSTKSKYSACITTKSNWGSITNNYFTKNLKSYSKDEIIANDIELYANSPKTNFLLMGFSEEDYNKAKKVSSERQLYIQAGNSIVVTILEKIFQNLFLKEDREK